MSLILVTRPQPDAGRFAEMLAARGHPALIAPLLEIVPVEWRLECLPKGLILTSRHALPALAKHPELRALPCFTVGVETARLAGEMGCAHVTHAPNIAVLHTEIARQGATGLLYLRGREVAQEMSGDAAVVYEARPVDRLPEHVCDAFKAEAIAAAAFFSVRTAQVFARLAHAAGIVTPLQKTDAVAISGAVAAVLAALPWRAVSVSAAPDAAHMAETIDNRLSSR